MEFKFLFLTLLIFSIARFQTINTYFTTTQNGKGTYYGTTTGGNCAIYRGGWPTFINQNPNIINVALNSAQYADSLPCGMCLNMTGNGVGSGNNPIQGNFVVYITDSCPSCASADLDLARNGDGRWDIQWKAIDCPVGNNKINYIFEGSNNFYIKIQPRGARQPVKEFYALVAGSYQQLTRTNDNFFQKSFSTQLSFPLTIRMVNIFGEQLDDVVPNLDNSLVIAGNNAVQFSASTNTPTTTPTTTTPSTIIPSTNRPSTLTPSTLTPSSTSNTPSTVTPSTVTPSTITPSPNTPSTPSPSSSITPSSVTPSTVSPSKSPAKSSSPLSFSFSFVLFFFLLLFLF